MFRIKLKDIEVLDLDKREDWMLEQKNDWIFESEEEEHRYFDDKNDRLSFKR